MKKLISTALMLIQLSAFSAPQDTIKVKLPEGNLVAFYSSNNKGLKVMQKYDLNLILKEMAKELYREGNNSKKMNLKDYEGDSYTFNKLKKSNSILKSLEFNYYLGLNYTNTLPEATKGLYSILSNFDFPDGKYGIIDSKLFSKMSNNILASPYFGTSFGRNFSLNSNMQKEFKIRVATEANIHFLSVKYDNDLTSQITVLPAENLTSPFVFGSGDHSNMSSENHEKLAELSYNETNKSLFWTAYGEGGNVSRFEQTRYAILSGNLNLRVVPNFTLNNGNGKRILNVGLGVIGGINLGTMVFNRTINSSNNIIQSNFEFSPLHYGVVLELGIGGVNIFAQTQYFKRMDTRSIPDPNNTEINNSISNTFGKDRIPMFTLGLRFGK